MKFLDCEGMYPARQGSVKKKKKKKEEEVKKKEAKKGPSRDRILSVAADEQKESGFWRLGGLLCSTRYDHNHFPLPTRSGRSECFGRFVSAASKPRHSTEQSQ